jgi:hypothetical protein
MDSLPKYSSSGSRSFRPILWNWLPRNLHGAAKLHHRRLQAILCLRTSICQHAAVHNRCLPTPGGTPNVPETWDPVGMLTACLYHFGAGIDPVCFYSVRRGSPETESVLSKTCPASKSGCCSMMSWLCRNSWTNMGEDRRKASLCTIKRRLSFLKRKIGSSLQPLL